MKFQIDWLNITFLGEAETIVRSGIKFWFADVELSTSDSILGLFLLILSFTDNMCVGCSWTFYFYEPTYTYIQLYPLRIHLEIYVE